MVWLGAAICAANLVSLGACIHRQTSVRDRRAGWKRQDDLPSTVLDVASSSSTGVVGGVNRTLNATTYDFSGKKWLGYGVNLFQVMPFDIDTIEEGTSRALPFLDLGEEKEKIFTFADGADWLLPKNVACGKDSSSTEGKLISYESGDEAASKLAAQASLSARYEVSTAAGAAKIGVRNAFSNNLRYAMWTYKDHTVSCEINNWQTNLKSDNVLLALRFFEVDNGVAVSRRDGSKSPFLQWDEKDSKVKDTYRSFFRTYGTHIITSSLHGSTASVTSWASNHKSEGSSYFKADVSAAFEGLVSSGKFDAKLAESDQYKEFEKSFEYLVYCRGGDPKLAAQLEANSQKKGAYELFEKWQTSAAREPPLARITTVGWADMMRTHPDKDVRSFAPEVQTAFDWLAEHPQVHTSQVRMTIDSDWGEIALLNPAASIAKKDGVDYPPGTQIADAKFSWYDPGGKPQATMQFDFLIVNGGEKVDIKLSHGRDSVGKQGGGSIVAYIEQKPYENDDVDPKRINGVVVNPIGKDEAFPPSIGLWEASASNSSTTIPLNATSQQVDTFARRSRSLLVES